MYKNYDYNLFGDSEASLTLTAYPDVIVPEDGVEYLTTDYSEANSISLKLTFPKDLKAMEYLLDDLYINEYPLTDYDDWLDISEIPNDCPEVIRQFLESLPINQTKLENA